MDTPSMYKLYRRMATEQQKGVAIVVGGGVVTRCWHRCWFDCGPVGEISSRCFNRLISLDHGT